jgi:outer membrane protein TolC
VSFQSLQKQLERTDEAVASALRAYELAEQGYRGGLVDYLDVLNAQAALPAEQRARALIVAEQFLAHAGLMKALGGATGKVRSSLTLSIQSQQKGTSCDKAKRCAVARA